MQVVRFKSFHAVGIALLMLICLAASPQRAAAQDAASFISSLGTRGLQALSPSMPAGATGGAVQATARRTISISPEISRFVLGPYARMMSPGAQQQFAPLFRDYLAQVYMTRLSRYADAPFRVTGSRPCGRRNRRHQPGLRRTGPPVEIDWHVTNQNGHYLVTDVVVDGVSMKATQRSEFASIIQRNGGQPDALVSVLRQQLAQAR